MFTPTFKFRGHFDRSIIRTRWKKINESPLKRAGLKVRKIAIRSVRTVPPHNERPSKPGKPYRSRSLSREAKMIFSVPNRMDTSVMIGPVGFGPSPAPELHEKGKSAMRLVKVKGKKRKGAKGRFVKSRNKFITTRVQYPKRPVMVPALDKVEPTLPPMWRNSVRP